MGKYNLYYNNIMVKLVTVATHSEAYMPWLLESCKKHRTEITILGWQEKWQGFRWRYELMLEFLKSVDDDELICFIDSYDVILLKPLEELEIYYNKIGREIVISSENVVSGVIETLFGEMKNNFFSLCDNKRLNAGLYMARCKYLKPILIDILQNYNKAEYYGDDQIMITKHCNNNKKRYHVDIENDVFLTVFNPMFSAKNDNIKIINEQLFYNDKSPFFIHGNGNTRLDDIIVELGYNMSEQAINDTYKHNIYVVLFKKCPIYTYQYFKSRLWYYLMIIIIIYCVIKIFIKYVHTYSYK